MKFQLILIISALMILAGCDDPIGQKRESDLEGFKVFLEQNRQIDWLREIGNVSGRARLVSVRISEYVPSRNKDRALAVYSARFLEEDNRSWEISVVTYWDVADGVSPIKAVCHAWGADRKLINSFTTDFRQ